MPHVEVLPNSAAHIAPGWTYVVDTGYDPSKVALNPKNKKRAAAQPRVPRGENELSSRQQLAIARRIAELNRDNDPSKSIEIPGKAAVPKTQNARRIIQYQRQIKHWLDDEEAQLAQLQQAPQPRAAAAASRLATAPSRRSSTMALIPPTASEATTPGPALPAPAPAPPKPRNERDDERLLSIDASMPSSVNPAELQALLSAPPLSYAASHASLPPVDGPPRRHFCDNCGYWGKIKCMKCGAKVCGLECKDAHEATRCLKWA
ncbi:hypothetical protein P280DRAFT_37163 [Massarina eburnea CBS 473.64]|uniref:HIT-type domain-containing protein n=1 Tax=Massarina eburnea CBS 473.64 TaxID=1395130 RepID=A0A6A6RI32_9PLEO|nr:hypothetical protein P280DRAFT_37163 [Massarina eburnea CBS 473.64]